MYIIEKTAGIINRPVLLQKHFSDPPEILMKWSRPQGQVPSVSSVRTLNHSQVASTASAPNIEHRVQSDTRN